MVLTKSGSKLDATPEKIFAEGCEWQNKIAEILIKAELSQLNIGVEDFEIFSKISIKLCKVIYDYEEKSLIELATSKNPEVKILVESSLLQDNSKII